MLTATAPPDGVLTAIDPAGLCRADWPAEPAEIVYLDGFGNAMTGLGGGSIGDAAVLEVGGIRLTYARTFGERPKGTSFWYRNSIGLVEIAVSSASAAEHLGLAIGSPVAVHGDRADLQRAR